MRMDKHDNANQANDFEARTQEEGKSFYKSSETGERERNELIVSLLSVSLCCYMFPWSCKLDVKSIRQLQVVR